MDWRIGLAGAVAAALGVLTARAQAPLDWRWSNPLPHGNNIADLIHHSGRYVQVTDHGGIYFSTNRLFWERLASGTQRDLRGAAFLGNLLVITGEEGTALWWDGVGPCQRATVTPATTDWLEGVASSPDRAVAVGDNGAIYRTFDGRAWQRIEGAASGTWLSGVAYGAGVFVAVGEGGFLATSPDGEGWTRRNAGTNVDLTRVSFGESGFLAVGRSGVVLVSDDGTGWTVDGTTGTANDLLASASGPTRRLVVGESAALLRQPPGGWTTQISTNPDAAMAPDWTYLAAVWDGERFVAAGRTGVAIESVHTNVLITQDLTFWFRLDASPRNWLWETRRFGGLYLAVGDRATILSSPSGADWSLESSPAEPDTVLYGVGGSPTLALAVGSDGTVLRSRGWSTNRVVTNSVPFGGSTYTLLTTNRFELLGVLWERIDPAPTTNTLQGVAWDGRQFVVVGGGGTVLRSPDGADWTVAQAPTTAFLSAVAPSPFGWVAAGTGGTLLASPDAEDWTVLPTGTTNWIYRVRAFDEALVAVGQRGRVWVSTNGVEWQPRDSGTEVWLTDVAQVGRAYYVCGVQGALLRSTNLVSWIPVAIPTGKALYGLAAQGSQLIASGAEGIILRTVAEPGAAPVEIPAFRHLGDGGIPVDLFLFEGSAEQDFRLHGAQDLGGWSDLDGFQLNAGGTLTHAREGSRVRRFYRTMAGDGD